MLDTGTIIVALAILIFYVRFLILKGRKKKQGYAEEGQGLSPAQIEKAKKARKYGVKNKGMAGESDTNFRVTSWWFFGFGFLLACLGVAMKTSEFIPSPYAAYWWIAVTLGILVLAFCFK